MTFRAPPCMLHPQMHICKYFRSTIIIPLLGWRSRYGAALLFGRSRDRFPVVSLGIFSVVLPTEPCALRSTQPLKVSARDLSWGKDVWCVWLTTYHTCSAERSRKSGDLSYPEPLGPPRPVDLYFLLYYYSGFDGLRVACWPLVPKFAGSNPAEAFGFLRAKEFSARLSSEGK